MNHVRKNVVFAKLCKVDENPELGMWLLYGTIIILSALVYNLGFARKLSIKKYSDIYIVSDWVYSVNFLCSFYPLERGLL